MNHGLRWGGVLALVVACGNDPSPANATADGGAPPPSNTTSGGTSGATTTSGGGPSDASPTTPPATCESNPLRTGLVAQQTGVSVDSFDCAILTAAAKHNEPDPMIFKAMIYVESRFDALAVGCPNRPCGMPNGWTDEESRCYGLMQIVPACPGFPKTVLLPNGHPNLTKDTAAGDYAGSVFNPTVNVDVGIAGAAGNRAQWVKQFPGCTVDQYTMMTVGSLASYSSTKGCTQYNVEYTKIVLDAYRQYAAAAKYTPHAY